MPSFDKFDKHHCPKEDADLVLKSKQKKIVGVFEKKFKVKHTQAVLEKVITDIELPLDDASWPSAFPLDSNEQPQYPSPPASYVCLSQQVGLPDCLSKKDDVAIARLNYACLENLRIVTANGYQVPIQFRSWDEQDDAEVEPGFVYVYSLALNAFERGLGVKGVQSKIQGDADAEDPDDDANNKLRLAQNFAKLGCFCVDVPYEVTVRLLNATTQDLTDARVLVDLRLGIRAKPKEFDRLKREPGSISYGSSKFDGKKKCGTWHDDKPTCANPCCPANPCGKLIPKECGDELILARGQTRKLEHVCVRANAVDRVTTTVDLPLNLCPCCKGKLLTNAWCLSAQIVHVDGATPPAFEQIRLVYDGQEDEQILTQFPAVDSNDPELFQAPTEILRVGKGVQAILSKITQTNQSSDAELGQLQLAKQFDDFVFAVDCATVPHLLITATPQAANFDVDILYSFRFATRVELDDGHRSQSHEH